VPAEETPAFGAIAERFRRAGDLERAIALCQDGLRRFPDHLSARVTLGWSLLDLGRYDEAREALEQVLKRAPDNLAAIRGLAELHDRAEHTMMLPMDGPGQWPPPVEHGDGDPPAAAASIVQDSAPAEAPADAFEFPPALAIPIPAPALEGPAADADVAAHADALARVADAIAEAPAAPVRDAARPAAAARTAIGQLAEAPMFVSASGAPLQVSTPEIEDLLAAESARTAEAAVDAIPSPAVEIAQAAEPVAGRPPVTGLPQLAEQPLVPEQPPMTALTPEAESAAATELAALTELTAESTVTGLAPEAELDFTGEPELALASEPEFGADGLAAMAAAADELAQLAVADLETVALDLDADGSPAALDLETPMPVHAGEEASAPGSAAFAETVENEDSEEIAELEALIAQAASTDESGFVLQPQSIMALQMVPPPADEALDETPSVVPEGQHELPLVAAQAMEPEGPGFELQPQSIMALQAMPAPVDEMAADAIAGSAASGEMPLITVYESYVPEPDPAPVEEPTVAAMASVEEAVAAMVPVEEPAVAAMSAVVPRSPLAGLERLLRRVEARRMMLATESVA
jgi:hypothetical protein